MRAARRNREGRRDRQPFGPLRHKLPIELRKAHVVAHREPQPADGRIRDDHLTAGRHVRRLEILFITAGNGNVEQMNLVVARDPLAVGINEQRCIRYPSRRIALDDGGAAENP